MKNITAGALVRRDFRRFLLFNNIKFSEEKGWLDSEFYLDCSDEVFKLVVEKVDLLNPNRE